MITFRNILICFLIVLFAGGCQKERYRKDRKNKLTKHAKKSSDYLAREAIDLTQGNIAKRDANKKKDRKRLEKHQEELNEANARSSKVKAAKSQNVKFKFY